MALGRASPMFHGSSGRRAPRRCHEHQGCAFPLRLQPRNANAVRANRYVPRRAICSSNPCSHALLRSMLRRRSNHNSPRRRACREQQRQSAGPSAGSSAKGNCNLIIACRPAVGVGQETDGLQQLRTRSNEEFSAAAIHRAVSGLALPLSA